MEKLVTSIEYDSTTNLPVLTDVFGNTHIVSWEDVNQDVDSERYYLQTWVKNFTWPNTTAFHRISNSLVSGTYLTYTVPPKKCYHISFIMLAQSIWGGQGNASSASGVSYAGMFINDVLRVAVPFKNEVHYVLFSPLAIHPGTTVEFKFMPFDKKCDMGIVVGGPLIDLEEHAH